MDIKESKCPRVIHHNKYERNAHGITNWWYKLFSKLESEAFVSLDRKMEIMKNIFSEELLKRILNMLNYVEQKITLDEESITNDNSVNTELKDIENIVLNTKSKNNFTEQVGNVSKITRNNIGKINPYVNFFNRQPERAAIWYPMRSLTLDEMKLIQKAEAITERIATEFVEWLKEMGGESSSIDVQTVIKMFEINFDGHVVHSLCVSVQEMPSVPEIVADSRNLPQLGKRKKLIHQIKRDIKASKQTKKYHAFTTLLPYKLQIHPPKKNVAESWLSCNNIPEDLETMAKVWQGITHLSSTRAYCEFLLEHPEIKPPKYLEKSNMLDPVTLRGPHYSIDTQQDMEPTIIPKGFEERNNL